jgi:hypothetical protein
MPDVSFQMDPIADAIALASLLFALLTWHMQRQGHVGAKKKNLAYAHAHARNARIAYRHTAVPSAE